MDRLFGRSATLAAGLGLLLVFPLPVRALDFDGVQPYALDNPQIYGALRDADGNLIQDSWIQAFLDTGASGVMLSYETATGLGITHAQYTGTGYPNPVDIEFTDVGVGGTQPFYVSNSLNLNLGNFTATTSADEPSIYTSNLLTSGLRTQLTQTPVDAVFGDPLDVFGMPTMLNRVVVINPKPPEELVGYMDVTIHEPTDASIPATLWKVRLSYATFADYTTTSPPEAIGQGPALAHNPFIGPSPTGEGGATQPPGITVTQTLSGTARSSTGSWLLDTGAMISMMSTARAADLHIYVKYITVTDPLLGTHQEPRLIDDNGDELPNQFVTQIAGVGDKAPFIAGIRFESLAVPLEGEDPLVYLNAPVFIADIVLENTAGQELTLDGILGMNFLAPSLNLDTFDITVTPFDWIVFNEKLAYLGLQPKAEFIPEPTSLLAAALFIAALGRHRRLAPSAGGR